MTPEMQELMGFDPELDDLDIDLTSPYKRAADIASATAVFLTIWLSIGWMIWRILQ